MIGYGSDDHREQPALQSRPDELKSLLVRFLHDRVAAHDLCGFLGEDRMLGDMLMMPIFPEEATNTRTIGRLRFPPLSCLTMSDEVVSIGEQQFADEPTSF